MRINGQLISMAWPLSGPSLLLEYRSCMCCSATGVSEVQNMAYMDRLGLWGPGSAFPNFEAFLDSMKRRGVSFLEMLSMEMKAEGYYVARGLSFRSGRIHTFRLCIAISEG